MRREGRRDIERDGGQNGGRWASEGLREGARQGRGCTGEGEVKEGSEWGKKARREERIEV